MRNACVRAHLQIICSSTALAYFSFTSYPLMPSTCRAILHAAEHCLVQHNKQVTCVAQHHTVPGSLSTIKAIQELSQWATETSFGGHTVESECPKACIHTVCSLRGLFCSALHLVAFAWPKGATFGSYPKVKSTLGHDATVG